MLIDCQILGYKDGGRLVKSQVDINYYQHGEGKGTLVVIIDDGINVQKQEVEKSFSSKLGFSPLIYYRSEIKKKLGYQFLIFIGKTESGSQFHEIKGLTKSPVLSISYPDGISDLYEILTGNL